MVRKMNPIDLGQIVSILVGELIEEDKAFILETGENAFVEETHLHSGMALRNGLRLWDKRGVIPTWFRETLKIKHPDEMSGVITREVWRKVRGLG